MTIITGHTSAGSLDLKRSGPENSSWKKDLLLWGLADPADVPQAGPADHHIDIIPTPYHHTLSPNR